MRWLLSLLACLHFVVLASDAERARIAAERQTLIERFAQEERECQQRFAVTACLDDVRSRRRAALAPLRARELKLDEAERQQRADERRAAIEAKQRAQATRPTSPSPPPELKSRQRAPPAPAASAASAAPAAAAGSGASAAAVVERRPVPADSLSQAARAAERAQAAQRRRDEAAATRARIEKRLAEREAAGKTVSPLPVPGSAPSR